MPDLVVNEYHGGKTNYYIGAPLHFAKEADNLLIDRNKKPFCRNGCEIYNSTCYQIPAGAARIGWMKYLDSILFQQSSRNLYYIATGTPDTWATLVGPVDSNPFFAAGNTTNYVSMAEWQKHFIFTNDSISATYSNPRILYKDGSTWKARNAGVPALASSPTITPTVGGAAAVSVVYGFYYSYDYTVGTTTYTMRGPITQVSVSTGTALAAIGGGANAWAVSGIPAISNGTTGCYATDAITIEIYRTTNSGSTLKYAGRVTNGTTTFTDNVADASLGAEIYTTSGIFEDEEPPPSKYVAVANNIAWYANVRESSTLRPNRIRPSLPSQPLSCPADIYVDTDGDITGISNIGIYPIVFEETRVWRLEGYVDNLNQGAIRKVIVSETIGAIGQQSIVKAKEGLYFCSLDGFYFTDGYDVKKLSDHLNETYPTLITTETKKKRVYGVLDNLTGRVYWALQYSSGSSDNDKLFVLDPYFGLSETSCFTTFSGTSTNFSPTAIEFISGILYRADSRGYVFKHSSTKYNDLVVNTSVNPSTWAETAVIYDLTSVAFNFGTDVNKKYITKILAVLKNNTNNSLQIKSCNDDSTIFKDLKPYRFRSNINWGDDDVIWGDETIIWNWTQAQFVERHMPAGSLRCTYKQVKFTNAYTVIINSDTYGTATVNATAKTIALDGSMSWPTDCVGYYIHVARDNYVQSFLITARTPTTLTVSDSSNYLTNGSQEWVMKGYRKNERFTLQAYTIPYQYFGESHPGYVSTESGENA